MGSLEQSVLNTLLVAQPVETDTPERSAMASQLDYGQSKLELLARPMLDITQYGNTEMDTDPSESLFGPDRRQSTRELADAMRREVLRMRSMGHVSASDVNGLMLSPEDACLCDKEISLDEVRSEGLRQWNMDMDVEYQ